MAELNPFEAPSEKPPADGVLSDRQLLELRRGPPRESFGDRYFWPLIALLGLGIVVVPWLLELPIQFKGAGLVVIVIGLWGWIREARKR